MDKNMNRRDFFKAQLKGLLCLSAASSGVLIPGQIKAKEFPDIAVAEGAPAAATRAVVELLGGIKTVVKPGNRVLIKPNMSFATPPERASNTHPEVVREVVILCKEAGAGSILVLDNPLADEERCLTLSGIREACEEVGGKIVHMIRDRSLFTETTINGGMSLKKTDIAREAVRSDVLIAVPVAKSHSGAGVSLSLKGMMGLIHNRMIMHRLDLHTAIVDLASVLKAHLTIIDATRVLSTGGPGGPGKVLQGNKIIASKDMVAADAYTVSLFEWYGKKYSPNQVRHIREAHERGLGRMDIEQLTVKTIKA